MSPSLSSLDNESSNMECRDEGALWDMLDPSAIMPLWFQPFFFRSRWFHNLMDMQPPPTSEFKHLSMVQNMMWASQDQRSGTFGECSTLPFSVTTYPFGDQGADPSFTGLEKRYTLDGCQFITGLTSPLSSLVQMGQMGHKSVSTWWSPMKNGVKLQTHKPQAGRRYKLQTVQYSTSSFGQSS